jgi:hypothetical protein
MLTSDFRGALEVTSKTYNKFLMIGRRWDTNVTEPWDFNQAEWDERLRSLALLTGRLNGPSWVDYFCFSRDLYYGKMPPFLIGRNGWDPWLTWFARKSKVPLVDVSRAVVAVHQNHDYAYLKQGAAAIYRQEEMSHNWSLGDGPQWHYYAVNAATKKFVRGNLRSNPLALFGPIQRRIVCSFYSLWFLLLKATRPIRHPLGLRRS